MYGMYLEFFREPRHVVQEGGDGPPAPPPPLLLTDVTPCEIGPICMDSAKQVGIKRGADCISQADRAARRRTWAIRFGHRTPSPPLPTGGGESADRKGRALRGQGFAELMVRRLQRSGWVGTQVSFDSPPPPESRSPSAGPLLSRHEQRLIGIGELAGRGDTP